MPSAFRRATIMLTREGAMTVPATPSHAHWLRLPEEPARRIAWLSLLMVGGTAVAMVVAGAIGTFFQLVVFGLEEQELLPEAGAWGYVVGVALLVLMAAPGVLGIALGVRARRLGERRLGTAGIVVNAVIAAVLVLSVAVNLMFG
jgi:hypothetical protein